MNPKFDHNNKSHKTGYHPYRQDRRDTNHGPSGTRLCISSDRRTAKYYIHPYSFHNRDNACLQKPEEIGTILSESKLEKN